MMAAQRILATRLESGDEIASFSLGGRDTRVVRVGAFPTSEFVAQWADTGAVIGIPELTLERAAHRARVAAMPPDGDEDDDVCCAGCSRCLVVQGFVF